MARRSTSERWDEERKSDRRRRWTGNFGQVEREELEAIAAEVEQEEGQAEQDRLAGAAWLETIGKVAGALLCGAHLRTDTFVVGSACANEGPRWVCIRARDRSLIEVFHAVDEGRLDERGPFAVTRWERDWSAFGAARAFVDSVGVDQAMAALEGRATTQPKPSRPIKIEAAHIAG